MKDDKIVTNQDGGLKVPLSDLKPCECHIRCQNLIGSYASTHGTFNLIGSCNRNPNTKPHRDTYAQTTDINNKRYSCDVLCSWMTHENGVHQWTTRLTSLPLLPKYQWMNRFRTTVKCWWDKVTLCALCISAADSTLLIDWGITSLYQW